MITDKNEALEAIRTRNPNVLDQISPELQDDMDIAMKVAEVFELQLRNVISLNGQENYWNKAREILNGFDISARKYREKEEEAQEQSLCSPHRRLQELTYKLPRFTHYLK